MSTKYYVIQYSAGFLKKDEGLLNSIKGGFVGVGAAPGEVDDALASLYRPMVTETALGDAKALITIGNIQDIRWNIAMIDDAYSLRFGRSHSSPLGVRYEEGTEIRPSKNFLSIIFDSSVLSGSKRQRKLTT